MASYKKLMQNSFSGVDRTSNRSESLYEAFDMRNFKVMPDGSLKKRDGVSTLFFSSAGKVLSVFCGTLNKIKCLTAVIGNEFWFYDLQTGTAFSPGNIGPGVPEKVFQFKFGEKLYILGGDNYYCYDLSELTVVRGYIPTVVIASPPSGGGNIFEEVNLLSSKRKARFSPDGKAVEFILPEENIRFVHAVKQNGEEIPADSYRLTEKRKVIFDAAPAAGTDCLEILYEVIRGSDIRERITKNTRACVFGGNTDSRVFLWGNPDEPSTVYHSALCNSLPSAEYFPENAFRIIGDERVTDIVQQYNRQLIFTKTKAYYSYCDLTKDSLGRVHSSFPVFSLNSSKGNLLFGTAANVDGCPVTLCEDGLNRWTPGNLPDEKNALAFSDKINPDLTEMLSTFSKASCENSVLYYRDFTSELFLCTDDKIFVFDMKNNSRYIYDGIKITSMCAFETMLYIGTADGKVLTLSKSDRSFDAFVRFKRCNFGFRGKSFSAVKALLSFAQKKNTDIILSLADENHTDSFEIKNDMTDGIANRAFRLSSKRVGDITFVLSSPRGFDAEIFGLGIILKDTKEFDIV